MKIYGMTDKGLVRSSNQDYFEFYSFSDNTAFAVVCDGMGGANAGNIASKTATQTISNYIKKSYRENLSNIGLESMIRGALQSANSQVYSVAGSNPDYAGMGTTVVLAFITGETGYVFHVGDSRAYVCENGKLFQLTVDHSMVQSLVDSGQITADQAKIHPKKNIITRALGVNQEVSVDMDVFDLTADTTLLLCSDGLSNFVSDSTILQELSEIDETVAKRLIQQANDSGGADNITAVVITQ